MADNIIKHIEVGGQTYYINASYLDSSTKEEIIAAARNSLFVVADELPTASSSERGKIYLIPSVNGEDDIKDEYVVVNTGSTASPVYAWEKIGNTDIKLTTVTKNTGGPSNNNTSNAGADTINSSEVEAYSAAVAGTITYSKAATSTGNNSGSASTEATTESAGAHTHSVSASGSTSYKPAGTLDSTGSHSHTVNAATASVVKSVSSTTVSVNSAPTSTQSAGNHSHTVSVAGHTHGGVDVVKTVTTDATTVLTGVKASGTTNAITAINPTTQSIYQITGVGSVASGSTVNCATVTVDGTTLIIGNVAATKMSSYGSVPTRQAVTVVTGFSDPTTKSVVTGVTSNGTTSVIKSVSTTSATVANTGEAESNSFTTSSDGSHAHGLTVTATTVVKSVSSTNTTVMTGATLSSAGGHSHTFSGTTATISISASGTAASAGAHSHDFTYNAPANHNHSITLSNASATFDLDAAIAKHSHSVTTKNHTHSLNSHTHSYSCVENDQTA